METYDLLDKYLKEKESLNGGRLTDYFLNGSTIKLKYSYVNTYDNGSIYWCYDGEIDVEILDFITWVFNLKK